MLIEVLGLPDDRTAALEAALGEALAQLAPASAATVRRIEDTGAMIARGVRTPPALRVDGRIVCRGRVPDLDEVRGYLDAARTWAARTGAAEAQPQPPLLQPHTILCDLAAVEVRVGRDEDQGVDEEDPGDDVD